MLAVPFVKVCAGNLCSLVQLTKVMERPQENRVECTGSICIRLSTIRGWPGSKLFSNSAQTLL